VVVLLRETPEWRYLRGSQEYDNTVAPVYGLHLATLRLELRRLNRSQC